MRPALGAHPKPKNGGHVFENYNDVYSPKSITRKVTGKTIRQFLAEQIRNEVKRRFITHAQAASESGIARTVVTAVINGRLKKISTDRILKIADGLKLNIELKVEPHE